MKLLRELTEADLGLPQTSEKECAYTIRKAARAVLLDNSGRIAVMHVTRDHYHKLPGGGIEAGEKTEEALAREIREEAGVEAEILDEVGCIIEYRRRFQQLQISYCYLVKMKHDNLGSRLTESEKNAGFEVEWYELSKALNRLQEDQPIDYVGRFIQIRDLAFIKEALSMEAARHMLESIRQEPLDNFRDILRMLDGMLRPSQPFWSWFFENRERPVPFFLENPDEHLVSYFESGILRPGKVLDLGCGNGRNAVYLARQGCSVTAVDLSDTAIAWARELAEKHEVRIDFRLQSVDDFQVDPEGYDLVNDGGCLHHIPPHRRIGYLELVKRAVRPGGYFTLDCFRPGFAEGGREWGDWEVYYRRSMGGGLAYSEEKLKELSGDAFQLVESRPMRETQPGDTVFGKEFLGVYLWKRK